MSFYTNADELDGKKFYICSEMPAGTSGNNSRGIYYMTNMTVLDKSVDQIRKTAANDIYSAAVFTFTEDVSAGEGKYLIWYQDAEGASKHFLRASNGTEVKNLDFVTDETLASRFTVTFDGQEAKIECNGYHINMKGKHSGAGLQVYGSYDANDAQVKLIQAGSVLADDPLGLDGTSHVICLYIKDVDEHKAASTEPVQGNKKLSTDSVSFTVNDAGDPVSISHPSELTLWTFHSCGGNTYKIQAGDKGYLRVNGSTLTLVSSADSATVLSVTPANSKSDYAGRYRISVIQENIAYAVGLAIEDNFYALTGNSNHGDAHNNNAATDPFQWLYFAEQAKLEISREDYSGIYDGDEHRGGTITATFNGTPVDVTSLVLEYSIDKNSWSGTDVSVTDVADSKTAYVRASSERYGESDPAEYQMEVKKRTVTLTSETFSRPYDGTALKKPVVTVGGDGFVAGEVGTITATGSVTNVADSPVTNTITFAISSSNYDENNYSITKNEGTLSVTPAAITIKADNKEKEYDTLDSTDPLLTATVTGKPENGDEPAYSLERESGQSARNYAIRVIPGTNPNYTITTKNGTFSIKKADLTVSVRNQTYPYNTLPQGEDNKTYTDEADIVAKVEVTGLKGSDKLSSVTLNGKQTNVGEYPYGIAAFGAEIGTATGNYNISFVPGKLTIEEAMITLRVKKIWDDGDDQYHKRPASLSVELLADGASLSPAVTVTLTEAEDWTATVNVPKYNGTEEIVYSWQETTPENYTLSNSVAEDVVDAVSGQTVGVTTLTNTVISPATEEGSSEAPDPEIPKTGDSRGPWLGLLFVSAISLSAAAVLRALPRRKSES